MKVLMVISLLLLGAAAALAKPAACLPGSVSYSIQRASKEHSIDWVNMHFKPVRGMKTETPSYATNWINMNLEPTQRASG